MRFLSVITAWVAFAGMATASTPLVLNVTSYQTDGETVQVVLASGITIVVSKDDVNDTWTKAVEKALADQETRRGTTATSVPPSDENARPVIEAKCRQDWPDDFKMRKYCQGQQYTGLRALRSRQMTGSTLSVIRDKCAGDWPDDFKMREYCEQQQLKALRSLR